MSVRNKKSGPESIVRCMAYVFKSNSKQHISDVRNRSHQKFSDPLRLQAWGSGQLRALRNRSQITSRCALCPCCCLDLGTRLYTSWLWATPAYPPLPSA